MIKKVCTIYSVIYRINLLLRHQSSRLEATSVMSINYYNVEIRQPPSLAISSNSSSIAGAAGTSNFMSGRNL